mgnify:CR=1 FL=1
MNAAPRKKAAVDGGLESRDFEQRVKAIEALAAARDPRALELISEKLKDPDATVRWSAANALEALHDPRALPALQAAASDPSPLVANRARDAVRVLKPGGRQRTGALVHLATKDSTGLNIRGLESALVEEARRAMATQKSLTIAEDDDFTHTVKLVVQSVKESVQGQETLLEVTCTGTVVESPGNQLRFTTRVSAGITGGVPMTPALRAELVTDAVRSAAAALGEETAAYLVQPH